jgi:hypothetical protein
VTKRTTLLAGGTLIFIALIFACAITLLVIPGVQMLPQYRIGPEDILPAEQTIFLISHPAQEALQQWKTVFPVLDDVISDVPLDAIAVIQTGTVMQSVGLKRTSGAWDGKSCRIGSYQLALGTMQSLHQFIVEGPRLSQDRRWISLGRLPKSSWSFVRLDTLPIANTLAQRTVQGLLFDHATHLLISRENESTVIRSWTTTPLSPLARKDLLILPMHYLEAVFALGNLEEAMTELENSLSQDDRIILEGLLLQNLEDLSGSNVSLRHELLPLLATDAEIYTGTTASGAQSILLTGTARNTTDVALRIDALHRSFALRHLDVELLEFAFDDGRFPFQTLRLSPTASKRQIEKIRGWTTTMSKDATDGAMLVTAMNGGQTAISNDPELLQRYLMEEGSGIHLLVAKRPIISHLGAAMVIPNMWLQNAPFWMAETGKSVVSVEQAGEARTVRVMATDNLEVETY